MGSRLCVRQDGTIFHDYQDQHWALLMAVKLVMYHVPGRLEGLSMSLLLHISNGTELSNVPGLRQYGAVLHAADGGQLPAQVHNAARANATPKSGGHCFHMDHHALKP